MVGVSSANMNVNCEFASQVCGLGCMQAQTIPCGSSNVLRDEQSMHIYRRSYIVDLNSVKKLKYYFAKCELGILIQTNDFNYL